ncbi:MAG: TRAM domain-containing protein, partial [Chloroflexota bacterium]
ILALMATQTQISTEINQSQIGKRMDVLIEGQDKKQNILIGRSKRDAPEIDGFVIVEGKGEIGDLIPVRINGALTHDLIGTAEIVS